jgi:hypothetical protein
MIEFKEDLAKDKEIFFSCDGEFYIIRNAKKIDFKVDAELPRIKMLRFNPEFSPDL